MTRHDWLGSEKIGCEHDPSIPADTPAVRAGRCYEITAWTLLFSPDVPNGTKLVHGSIHGRMPWHRRIAHAWLRLPDGAVWEPRDGEIYGAEEWREFARARVQRVYTTRDARRNVFFSETWGPWHNVGDSQSGRDVPGSPNYRTTEPEKESAHRG